MSRPEEGCDGVDIDGPGVVRLLAKYVFKDKETEFCGLVRRREVIGVGDRSWMARLRRIARPRRMAGIPLFGKCFAWWHPGCRQGLDVAVIVAVLMSRHQNLLITTSASCVRVTVCLSRYS